MGLLTVLAIGLAFALIDPFSLVTYVIYVGVGATLVIRRPRNSIGWLLIAIGFGFIGTSTPADLDLAALAAGTASVRDSVVGWFNAWAGSASFLGYFALTVVFPGGRLPEGRWRWPTVVALTAGLMVVILTALAPTIGFDPGAGGEVGGPNPFAILPDLSLWAIVPMDGTLILPVIILMVAGVVSIVVRYRRSTGILHLQLRWLVAALAFAVGAVIFGLTLTGLVEIGAVGDLGGLIWIPAIIAYPTIPIAIGVAVLRYRLLEIDRIVSRTVAYTLVTAILAIVFAGTILLLQGFLSQYTQGQAIAVAASTLVVYAVFQPVLRRVRRGVDLRFDRARIDAERTSAAFSERLRNVVDIESVSSDLDATVREAIKPTRLGLWLREAGR